MSSYCKRKIFIYLFLNKAKQLKKKKKTDLDTENNLINWKLITISCPFSLVLPAWCFLNVGPRDSCCWQQLKVLQQSFPAPHCRAAPALTHVKPSNADFQMQLKQDQSFGDQNTIGVCPWHHLRWLKHKTYHQPYITCYLDPAVYQRDIPAGWAVPLILAGLLTHVH